MFFENPNNSNINKTNNQQSLFGNNLNLSFGLQNNNGTKQYKKSN